LGAGEIADSKVVFGLRTAGLSVRCKDSGVYQRVRYLSDEKSKRLKTLLRFVVCEEDHLETDCITCHLARKL
jgi:hypothetical protein